MNRRNRNIAVAVLAIAAVVALISGPNALAAENRGLAVHPGALPAELKNVAVLDYFIPGATRAVGTLQTVIGTVVVARDNPSGAYFAKAGDRLHEKDVIFTLRASRARVKLDNEDIVTLGENTHLGVKEATGSRDSTEKRSLLSMVRGKAMFYAIRLFKHKTVNMSVESPTAVVGVRGTKFGMDVVPAKAKTLGAARRFVHLADNSGDWGRHIQLAQLILPNGAMILPGSGGGSGSLLGGGSGPLVVGGSATVHGFSGTVQVTSTITGGGTILLGPGQSLVASGAGLGTLTPTLPGVSQQFLLQTNVPPPGGTSSGGASGGQGGGTSGGGTVSSGGTLTPGGTGTGTGSIPPGNNLSDVIQNQNVGGVLAGASTNGTAGVLGSKGYFAGILTDNGGSLQRTFVAESLQDLNASSATLQGYNSSGTFMGTATINGASGTPKFTSVNTPLGYWSGSQTMVLAKTGDNALSGTSFLEWGTWTQPNAMQVSASSFYFSNQGWYIRGTPTTDSQMANMGGGSYTYSGNAYGTMTPTSGSGAWQLTGSFSTNVNFTAGTLSNFNISVNDSATGGTHNVQYSGGSGSFTGTTGAMSQFSISGGSATINDLGGGTAKAYGSVYGPSGQAMGGNWKAGNANYFATGVFQGKQGTLVP